MSFFDESYYLGAKLKQLAATNEKDANGNDYTLNTLKAAITDSGMTAEEHYEAYGRAESLNPNAYFNEAEYLAAKVAQLNSNGENAPDGKPYTVNSLVLVLEESGMTAAQHYQDFGSKETTAEGHLLNPSNAFDANAYVAAKLVELQKTDPAAWADKSPADVAKAITDSGLSPVSHYESYGAAEAASASVPLVQTVPSAQRVPNDPIRETFKEVVPTNYNPPTLAPAKAVAAPVAKPADVAQKVPATISPEPIIPEKSAPTPTDSGYVTPPANIKDTAANPVIPPSSTDSSTASGNWMVVNPDKGTGTIIGQDGEIKGEVKVEITPGTGTGSGSAGGGGTVVIPPAEDKPTVDLPPAQTLPPSVTVDPEKPGNVSPDIKPENPGESGGSGGSGGSTESGGGTETPADTTAPVFASAELSANGTTLTLTYGEDLSATNVPEAGAFTVKVGGSSQTVTGVTVSGKTVVLSLGSAVLGSSTVTVSYKDPTSGDDAKAIQDATGNDAVSITDQSVTNNSGVTIWNSATTIAAGAKTYDINSATDVYFTGGDATSVMTIFNSTTTNETVTNLHGSTIHAQSLTAKGVNVALVSGNGVAATDQVLKLDLAGGVNIGNSATLATGFTAADGFKVVTDASGSAPATGYLYNVDLANAGTNKVQMSSANTAPSEFKISGAGDLTLNNLYAQTLVKTDGIEFKAGDFAGKLTLETVFNSDASGGAIDLDQITRGASTGLDLVLVDKNTTASSGGTVTLADAGGAVHMTLANGWSGDLVISGSASGADNITLTTASNATAPTTATVAGKFTIDLGSGDDTLILQGASNASVAFDKTSTFKGGDGSDILKLTGDWNGGDSLGLTIPSGYVSGFETIDLSGVTGNGVKLNMSAETGNLAITGSQFDDVIYGGSHASGDTINGGSGGLDYLAGELVSGSGSGSAGGADTIFAGATSKTIGDTGVYAESVKGGAGTDYNNAFLLGFNGQVDTTTTAADNWLGGKALAVFKGANILEGRYGDDVLVASDQKDVFLFQTNGGSGSTSHVELTRAMLGKDTIHQFTIDEDRIFIMDQSSKGVDNTGGKQHQFSAGWTLGNDTASGANIECTVTLASGSGTNGSVTGGTVKLVWGSGDSNAIDYTKATITIADGVFSSSGGTNASSDSGDLVIDLVGIQGADANTTLGSFFGVAGGTNLATAAIGA